MASRAKSPPAPSTRSNDDLPEFLRSFEELTAHFDEHFGDLGSNERGDTFLDLARRVIPLTEEGSAFSTPEPNPKKSHDDGVDLLDATDTDGRCLFAQSKYKIRSKDEFDLIVSKFHNFESQLRPSRQVDLFEKAVDAEPAVAVFFVVTSSKLETIVRKYEESTLASRAHYAQLRAQKRLVIVDGARILQILQQFYRKTHLIPATIELTSVTGWNRSSATLLGVVRGADLVQLHAAHGDALFFENIREFLGASSGKVVTTRSTVNQEIIHTVTCEPEKMLARNNGVTFRAEVVTDGGNTVTLTKAAIVNGCQTTMCLVHSAPISESCLVQVKIVQTADAWDIAKAANNQNPVARVDLDLARYLRPQLVRRVAAGLGYALETETQSASAVLNSIYRHKIDYDELKLLCLGLFSRKPNNLFEGNYAELREDVLSELYGADGGEESVFSVLLLLLKESRHALRVCEDTYSGAEYASLFRRFYDDDKPRYRVYLAVVAVCALVRDDLSNRSSDTLAEVQRTRQFLGQARERLENEAAEYHEAHLLTFQAVADLLLDVPANRTERTENEISQNMYRKVSDTAFSSLYKKVLMRIDSDRKRRARPNQPDGEGGPNKAMQPTRAQPRGARQRTRG